MCFLATGSKKLKIILVVLCGAAIYSGSLFLKSHTHTWGVCVSGLPEKVLAELADEDVPLYILKQTHEPLFRRDDGQNYSSKVLESWRRSVDSSSYTFCPDTSKRFDDNHPFSVSCLKAHIHSITRKYSSGFSVTQAGSCVRVNFKKGKKGYLDFLSKYENAPTLRKDDNVELGLGEFYVDSIGKDKIILKRKQPCRNGYNKIIIDESAGNPAIDFKKKDITDFNRISWREMPVDVSRRFLSFDSIPLKSGGLVITSPDKNLRTIIYNCTDISQFRQVAFPNKKRFNDIATILPVGVPGARSGKPIQVCDRRIMGSYRKSVVFANISKNNQAQLEKYAEAFHKITGIRIKIKNYTVQELVKTLFKRPHPYDLVLISFSVVQPEYDTFFKDFVVKDGFIDYDLPHLAVLRDSMLQAEDDQERTNIAVRIADDLSKEAVVLPLYQEVRTFYYPADIKNLLIGRGFTEYPEVADFRW